MRTVLRLLPLIATRRGLFIETVVWSAVTQTAVLGIALGLAWTVGHIVAGETVSLPVASFALPGLAILASVTAWRESWVSHDLAYRLIATLRGHVFDALRRALPSRTRHRRTGDLTTTVVADIETLEWLYAHTAAQTLSALLVLAMSAAVSISISPLLLLIWVPLLIIGVTVPFVTARRARRDGDELAHGAAALRSELLDTVRGLRELTGSGALDAQLERLTDYTRRLARAQVREASRLGAERGIGDIALALAALGAILIVLLDRATVGPENIPLAVTVAVAGLAPAAQIADLLRNASTLRAAAERITDVLGQPPAVDHRPRGSRPERLQESGLVFDQVGFSYDYERPVLKGLTMHIRPGEIVALTGPSGVGKTTAARLALRMWDPDTGSVRIDGTEISDIPDKELRSRITTVPQSSPLLRGTIRSNITLGEPEAAEEKVHEAATAAGLFDPGAGLPGGLDTPVGEHGAGLSGGQRARVAIARALLGNPRVLVLDEPTASLDSQADTAIMDFLSHSQDCAILLIAHRPATIAAAHRSIRLGS
ncbi:ABC transporter ATP-binding protein [Phytoactinopolyspora endophytica]|uniref:ABC transporter ATP-binding protein n=1 Tax=Phytoactinopolyspora endophytica TaxID=1642495 RepID=UPI00101D91EF|nr:ABC transporter ATP-binding protein [Phytoactinopolyspora endophytica]